MALLRPHIPLEVRCRVAMRQLGMTPEQIEKNIIQWYPQPGVMLSGYGKLLSHLLPRLRSKLGVVSLHLDHDPALENRERIAVIVRNNEVVGYKYSPDANDPDHLIYREGGFKGSAHDIKTRVRGERGQFADNVIAKRERRRVKRLTTKKRKHNWPKGRKIQSRNNLRRRP